MMLRRAVVTLSLLLPTSAFAAESDVQITWLKTALQMPVEVITQLNDCPYIKEHADEAWEENGETGGFSFSPAKGERVYVVTCDLGATNAFYAAVRHKGKKVSRLNFPMVNGNGEMEMSPTLGGANLQPDNRLVGGVMRGCLRQVATTLTYHYTGGKFELEKQEANDDCEKPNWQVIFPKKK
jgi:hypothetical protein